MSTQSADSAGKTSSNDLTRQISQCSLAAAVAGVGVLALIAPAAGEVVVTKKTIHIPMTSVEAPEPVKISMANNGVDNFIFNLTEASESFRSLAMAGATSNANPIYQGTFIAHTPALPRGAKIGSSATFSPIGVAVEQSLGVTGRGFRGYWGGNPKDHYLGVRFQLKGQTHYGWIRLTVTAFPNANQPFMSAQITGYAYETVANKPILAGTAGVTVTAEAPTAPVLAPLDIQKPAGPSLGMLALGADALPMWRLEETSVRQ